MAYFFSPFFFGRPTELESLIFSTTLGSYIFVLPTLRISFMPCNLIRLFTVPKGILRISAISNTVNSFMLIRVLKYLGDVNDIFTTQALRKLQKR